MAWCGISGPGPMAAVEVCTKRAGKRPEMADRRRLGAAETALSENVRASRRAGGPGAAVHDQDCRFPLRRPAIGAVRIARPVNRPRNPPGPVGRPITPQGEDGRWWSFGCPALAGMPVAAGTGSARNPQQIDVPARGEDGARCCSGDLTGRSDEGVAERHPRNGSQCPAARPRGRKVLPVVHGIHLRETWHFCGGNCDSCHFRCYRLRFGCGRGYVQPDAQSVLCGFDPGRKDRVRGPSVFRRRSE